MRNSGWGEGKLGVMADGRRAGDVTVDRGKTGRGDDVR